MWGAHCYFQSQSPNGNDERGGMLQIGWRALVHSIVLNPWIYCKCDDDSAWTSSSSNLQHTTPLIISIRTLRLERKPIFTMTTIGFEHSLCFLTQLTSY